MDEAVAEGLANLPGGSGNLIRRALTVLRWSWGQFIAWLITGNHMGDVARIAVEFAQGVAMNDPALEQKAVTDLVELIQGGSTPRN